MGKRKCNSWIRLLVAFWLLFSGICIDCGQTYPVLAWDNSVSADPSAIACRLTSGNRFTSEELCTSELLGQRTTVREAKEGEESGAKGRFRLRTVFLVPETNSAGTCQHDRRTSWSVSRESLNHAVIMNYIHNKDGGK